MYTDLCRLHFRHDGAQLRRCHRKASRGQDRCCESALEAYVPSEQQSMEHYLEDQYLVAKAATVTVAPTGEVDPGVRREPRHHSGQHRKSPGRISPSEFAALRRDAVSFCPQMCYTVPVIVQ